MESNQSCRRPNSFRTLLIFLFILVPFHLSMAQLTLSTSRASLGTIIKQIQDQSKYQFFYSDKLSAVTVEPIKVKDASLEVVLNTLLKEKNITYKVEDNIVYLSEKNANESNKLISQERNVSGTVKDSQGEPIIGASVQVKGTERGTITNLDGEYKLAVSGTGQVLVFSYIGYKKQEITIGAQSVINVTLKEDTQLIDEVVVTALGIKRAEKALSYNVQQVKAEEITTNKDVNFINSLSGKVAGVTINSSSSGPGGVSKVVMRGTKSIMQTSNALYVIDGIPIFAGRNTTNNPDEFSSQGGTDPVADINPEDIESMSVLTGAAAAALYGSDAANGAIIITTKKGSQGRLSLTVNSHTEFSSPLVMPRFQNRYGTGTEGKLSPTGALSWGSRLTDANNYGYNPKDDYLQTGVITTEAISLSTGTEKNQLYASAAVVNSRGIVPNNKYDRYNFTVRNTTSFLKDKMTFDINASYIMQNDRNMVNQGIYSNPLVGAYLYPRGNDWADIRMYERWDPARKINTQYWPVGDENIVMQNPYWVNYRNLRENKKDRYMLGASLSYQILDWLNLTGRVRIDNSNNDYTEEMYASSNTQVTEKSSRGLYGITKIQDKQTYADFMVNINKSFLDIWSLQANIGASYTDMREDDMKVRGPIADDSNNFSGEPVGLTNFFNIQNLSASKTERYQDGWRYQTQSVFASIELGYKNTYYLTVTGRNDWPSQLAGPNSAKSSFFYPSIGGSVLVSELIPELNKEYLSYLKVRGSWASVANPFDMYIANPKYEWNKSTGQWSIMTQYPMYNLKPERTNSWEFGVSMRFLNNFNLDVTYYSADTKNQTLDPKLPVSEYSRMYIQTGAVRNSGVELALGYTNTWKGFTWDSNFTFSTNKNRIKELADNAINPITGETFSLKTLNVGGLGETRFLLKEGGSMGDVYSLIDLKRDSNGNILIDANGQPSTQTIQNPDDYIKLGSALPKANLGWSNNFNWKNFNLGFLISARLGGIVFSRTQAMLDYYGVSEASADARDLGHVVVNGNDYINPQTWYSVIGSGTSVPQYYTYSATNVRLQEVSFGYTFPRRMLKDICDVRVSLIGRNLWMIYNKAPFDPESIARTDNSYQGIDYFMMPALRNIGFSLNFKF